MIISITNVVELNCSITFVNDFAERLRFARTMRNLSQAALAKACGLSQSAIGNYENRTRKNAKGIFRIAEVLGVNPGWLVMGTGPMLALPASSPSQAHYQISDSPANQPATPLQQLAVWPFELLPPEEFWSLSQQDRKLIEQAVISLTRSLRQKDI